LSARFEKFLLDRLCRGSDGRFPVYL